MSKVTINGKREPSALQKKVERDGYIWDNEFGMAEHRAVAYRILSRFLETHEHVHHCDHVKSNNDPRNLFVLSPAIHDIVHLCTLLYQGDRNWTCGRVLMVPEVLSEFLTKEKIPHIWLWEVLNDRDRIRSR